MKANYYGRYCVVAIYTLTQYHSREWGDIVPAQLALITVCSQTVYKCDIMEHIEHT